MKERVMTSFILLCFLVGCNHFYQKPSIEIAASNLEAAYQENSTAADEKYEGRILIINGNTSYYAEMHDTVGIYLERSSSTSEWQILCLINKSFHPDIYSKLRENSINIFTGKVSHEKQNNFIVLNDCQLK